MQRSARRVDLVQISRKLRQFNLCPNRGLPKSCLTATLANYFVLRRCAICSMSFFIF